MKDAFAKAEADGVSASDEAGLVERLGREVYVVLGSERNIKITKPTDMELAKFYLEREQAVPADVASSGKSGNSGVRGRAAK